MEVLLVSITETAKVLNLGRTSVYELINDGKLVFDGSPADLRKSGDGNLDQAFHTLTGASS